MQQVCNDVTGRVMTTQQTELTDAAEYAFTLNIEDGANEAIYRILDVAECSFKIIDMGSHNDFTTPIEAALKRVAVAPVFNRWISRQRKS